MSATAAFEAVPRSPAQCGQKSLRLGLVACLPLLAFLLGASKSDTPGEGGISGAEAVEAIDWSTVKLNSPIPRAMPAAQSDDPVEAGFTIEWIKRALPRYPFSPVASAIVSKHRSSDDPWANEMEQEVRTFIREKLPLEGGEPSISRVFCNDVGCLCYLEQEGASFDGPPIEIIGFMLRAGQRFGVTVNDAWAVGHRAHVQGRDFIWGLTVMRFPNPDSRRDGGSSP